MKIEIVQTLPDDIRPLRKIFLRAHDFQIRYEACHGRNWSDSYLLFVDGERAGYAAVKGKEDLMQRDTVFEFFLLPSYRHLDSLIFAALLRNSGASYIEAQTNEPALTMLLYEFAGGIQATHFLFKDERKTDYQMPDVRFRLRKDNDNVFGLHPKDVGDYVLERNGVIVATGGILTHYNEPFADLFMEVAPDCRRQGLGTYMVQALKKVCYQSGQTPAARCLIRNRASKATLRKAGMRVCGVMLVGEV